MGDRGAGEYWNEGIGCFAAKRGIRLDERALGMEAEMVLAEMRSLARRRFRCRRKEATEWRWVLSQNHCSGQPDGAAAL